MSVASNSDILTGILACMQVALKMSETDTAGVDLETTAAHLPGWTSMAHLELVLALENRFGVMFEADEIADLASVSAIVGALARRAD